MTPKASATPNPTATPDPDGTAKLRVSGHILYAEPGVTAAKLWAAFPQAEVEVYTSSSAAASGRLKPGMSVLIDDELYTVIVPGDINASGTRREELITNPQELPIIYRLRRLLGGMEPEQAYQTLVPRLKKTATNRDFLAAIIQQSNSNPVNGN